MYCPVCGAPNKDSDVKCALGGENMKNAEATMIQNSAAASENSLYGEQSNKKKQKDDTLVRELSVAGWLGTIFVSFIPIIGIINLFFFATGKVRHKELVNFSKAALLFIGILLIIGAFVYFAVFSASHK
jgi:hypothetical protein